MLYVVYGTLYREKLLQTLQWTRTQDEPCKSIFMLNLIQAQVNIIQIPKLLIAMATNSEPPRNSQIGFEDVTLNLMSSLSHGMYHYLFHAHIEMNRVNAKFRRQQRRFINKYSSNINLFCNQHCSNRTKMARGTNTNHKGWLILALQGITLHHFEFLQRN